MPRVTIGNYLWALATAVLIGCNQNPYMPPGQTTAWQQQAISPQQAQLYDMNRRAASLDENNQDLHAQLAQSRQQVQLLREQVGLLQKQLGSTAEQLKQIQVAKVDAERKYQELESTTTRRGGAIITANSSGSQALRVVPIEGLEIREEAGAIRIELPVDQLFAPGTAQPVGSAFPVLDRVATEIARNYPRQRIGIEGHTDSAPASGGISNHQLGAAQAVSVFEQLTRRNRLPAQQFVIIAQGPNRPLASNGTQTGQTRNRRVELIIYPETYDR